MDTVGQNSIAKYTVHQDAAMRKSLLERGKKEKEDRAKQTQPEYQDMSASPKLRKRKPAVFKAKARTPVSRRTVTKLLVPAKNVDGMVKYFEQMSRKQEDITISEQQKTKNIHTKPAPSTTPGPEMSHQPMPGYSTLTDPEMSALPGPTFRPMGAQKIDHDDMKFHIMTNDEDDIEI